MSAAMLKPRQILLVDDSADDVELTTRAFRRCEPAVSVVVARDGLAALDYLVGSDAVAPHDLPALVLIDVKMPRVGGIEVVRTLRANRRTRLVPIVLLTSSAEERDVTEAYAAGANGYVRKPITSEHFIDAIRSIAAFWLHFNEAAVFVQEAIP